MFFAYLILVAWCLCGEKKNEPPNSEESGARIQEGKHKNRIFISSDYWLLVISFIPYAIKRRDWRFSMDIGTG